MRSRRFAVGIASLAALALVVLSGISIPAGSVPGNAQGPGPAQGLPSSAFTPGAFWVREYLDGLNASDRASALSLSETETPTAAAAFLRVAHAPASLTPAELVADAHLVALTNWWQIGVAFAAGCIAGGAIGSIGAGVGALPGCLVGGATTAAVDYFAQQTAGPASNPLEASTDTILASDYANAVNGTLSSARTISASNNATTDFLENQASAMALNQLGYATFDPVLAVAQSGIAAELDSDELAIVSQLNGLSSVLTQWGISEYGSNGRFSGSPGYGLCLEDTALSTSMCNGKIGAGTFSTAETGVGVSSTPTLANESYFIPAGGASPTEIYCESTYTATIAQIAPAAGLTAYTASYGSGDTTFAGPAGVYSFKASNPAHCHLYAGVLTFIPLTPNTMGGTGLDAVSCGASTCTTPLPFNDIGSYTSEVGVYFVSGGVQYSLYSSNAPVPNFEGVDGNLMVSAELAADAYWTFLKSQGYTRASQIPAGCIIPYPSEALPQGASNALGNLTVGEALDIYEAWMNGIAQFFNTPVNSTTFCAGHPAFKGPGFLPSPDGVNVSGYLYFPLNSTKDKSEVFRTGAPNGSVLGTWAVNGSIAGHAKGAPVQMVIYPTVSTLTIPIGRVFEVPANDPIVALAPVDGPNATLPNYYLLHGNGSNVYHNGSGIVVDSISPPAGSSVYLTSCTVSGAPTANCTLTLSNLQGYIQNVTCPTGPNGCGPQAATSGGGGFTFGDLLSELANGICWITLGLVCGSTAQLLAEAIIGVVVVVLVVAAIAVAAFIARHGTRGRRESPPTS